jgi:hypothetical protein
VGTVLLSFILETAILEAVIEEVVLRGAKTKPRSKSTISTLMVNTVVLRRDIDNELKKRK